MYHILLSICILNVPIQADITHVEYSAGDGCGFSVTIDPPRYTELMGYWYPVIRGMGISLPEGGYVTPSRTYFVPVPSGIMPEMTCIPDGFHSTAPPGPLLVTPVISGTGLDTEWLIPPPHPSEISDAGYAHLDTLHIAGTTVAAVTVEPFSTGNRNSVPSKLNVRLSWPFVAGGREMDSRLLRALCLPGLQYWPISGGSRDSSPFWGLPWARIAVSATGPYRITCEELQQAGCSVEGVVSNSLRMFTGPGRQFELLVPEEDHELSEMAIEVSDGGDGLFSGSDALIFFGEPLNRFSCKDSALRRLYHRYATHNVYWLTWGGENGLRSDTINALPDGSPAWGDSLVHSSWQEQDYIWLPADEMRTGWVWSTLYEDIPGYFYFSSSSPDGPGHLSISLSSSSSGDHDVSFILNNELIADTTWTGRDEQVFDFYELTFEPSMNLLKVTTKNDPGMVYFDYFMIQYPRRLNYAANRMLRLPQILPGRYTLNLGGASDPMSLLDVTNPFSVSRCEGGISGELLSASIDITAGSELWLIGTDGYLSPDSILPAEPGRIVGSGIEGDIAVVVADHLMGAAGPIQTIYSMRGLSAAVVSAGEVYDEFGQGVRDPGAIRSFFRYTQDNWSSPAQALFLVGDGSYDPLMHVTSTPTMIPVYLKLGGTEGYPMDDLFVIAHPNGLYPEAPVSRITASSQAELASYLSKVMLYESAEASGEWANRILLIADDEWGNSSTNEMKHTEACEMLADSILPQSLDRTKFYLIEYPWPPGTSPEGDHPEKPEAREDLVEELSRGYANMIFFGHGSYGQIAHEKLLVSSDVNRIFNDRRQPVMIFATCNVGQFDLISAQCMAEDFVMKAGGGSIVSIAATRGTFMGANEFLFNDYYAFVFNGADLSVGECLWIGKITGLGSYLGNDHLYVVLGDGGIQSLFPSDIGCTIEISGDSLHRGSLNTLTGTFSESLSAFVNVSESGSELVYNCLGGGEIPYLRYGSGVYQALISLPGDQFTTEFFMPVQADTGSFSRCSALGISSGSAESAWQEWVSVYDDGVYSNDTLPPEIELWIQGYRGIDNPTVSVNPTLRAVLSDSSGIAAMGGGAGRSILMSLDSQGFDLSRYFTYQPNSHTRGNIEYSLPELSDGPHRLILVAWDGMGNSSRDTLDFTSSAQLSDLLYSVFVYPNPADDQRCFNFSTATDGTVSITVYTVYGRAIWSITASCREGYNQILWNGLDADGDEPASGSYIFRINFSNSGGYSSSVTDILAIIHEAD